MERSPFPLGPGSGPRFSSWSYPLGDGPLEDRDWNTVLPPPSRWKRLADTVGLPQEIDIWLWQDLVQLALGDDAVMEELERRGTLSLAVAKALREGGRKRGIEAPCLDVVINTPAEAAPYAHRWLTRHEQARREGALSREATEEGGEEEEEENKDFLRPVSPGTLGGYRAIKEELSPLSEEPVATSVLVSPFVPGPSIRYAECDWIRKKLHTLYEELYHPTTSDERRILLTAWAADLVQQRDVLMKDPHVAELETTISDLRRQLEVGFLAAM